MVFAPLLTSIDYPPSANLQAMTRPVQNGLMVNLGWVPVENKKDISCDPPVEAFEFGPENFDYLTCTFFDRQNAQDLRRKNGR